MLNEDDINISGTGKIDGLLLLRLPVKTSGLRRLGLLCGTSKLCPTLNVGGPRVDVVVVVINPEVSFILKFAVFASEKEAFKIEKKTYLKIDKKKT